MAVFLCEFSRAMSAAVNQSSAASVVEEVIQHHGEKLSNVDLYAARKAEEACMITSFDQLLFCPTLLILDSRLHFNFSWFHFI